MLGGISDSMTSARGRGMLRAVTSVSKGGCDLVMSIARAVMGGIASDIRSFSVGSWEANCIAEVERIEYGARWCSCVDFICLKSALYVILECWTLFTDIARSARNLPSHDHTNIITGEYRCMMQSSTPAKSTSM